MTHWREVSNHLNDCRYRHLCGISCAALKAIRQRPTLRTVVVQRLDVWIPRLKADWNLQ
jgi:hypothetical protein